MTAEKLKQYFDLSPIDSHRMTGVCKLCKRSYKDLYGIYSNFKKHLKRQHPLEYQKMFSAHQEENLIDEISNLDDGPTAIDSNNLANKSNRINLSITKNLIIRCNLPLHLIETSAFRDFMKECVPKWEPMSVKKLKSMIITSFKERIHKTIFETLQKVKDLSLTIDGWSDRRSRGFLGITCHFIDDNMLPQAYLVDFVRMKSPHTSENIQRQTEYVLDSFNIKEKVFRIITDNASNMIRAYKFGLSTEGETENCLDSLNSTMSDADIKIQDDDGTYHFTFVFHDLMENIRNI
jgi:BED zinc finger